MASKTISSCSIITSATSRDRAPLVGHSVGLTGVEMPHCSFEAIQQAITSCVRPYGLEPYREPAESSGVGHIC